jgi:polysaccharide export outer membrane protein
MRAIPLLFTAFLCVSPSWGQCSTNAASAPPTPPPSYFLRPNDTVQINVYREDDLTTTARVGVDGNIAYPLLGSVPVGGLNLAEAAELIRTRLDRDYVVNPHVTMTIAEFGKRRFTILGQVDKPGSYEFSGDQSVTLLEAVAMAGGFTRLADAGRIRVARVGLDQTSSITVDAKHESNVAEALAFRVRGDDTITVPERLF